MIETGARNLITDVSGLRVGNRHDAKLASGVTAVVLDGLAPIAATVFGGGPGTREIDAVSLEGSLGAADAIVISGGSAIGLDAATGVQSYLREQGRGVAVGAARVPIVPQAILFDLLNGGDKDWGRFPPYRDMAYEAARYAAEEFEIGSAGGGFGASVAISPGRRMRGGLGSASQILNGIAAESGAKVTVGALTAVNSVGAVTVGKTRHFWAAPFEVGNEFGGLGFPHPWPAEASIPVTKISSFEGANTTLCIVATDAALSRQQCKRVATMAAAGMARAIFPVFTPHDGDIVFVVSTGLKPLRDAQQLERIGSAAANCLSRAIARGVYTASGALPDGTPSYRDLFATP